MQYESMCKREKTAEQQIILYSLIRASDDVCLKLKCVGVRYKRHSVLVPPNKEISEMLIIYTHKPGRWQSKT